MRWRKVKQKKIISKQENVKKIHSAPIPWRIKAFITDIFMIYVPILYVTTYGILNGKDDFLENQLAIFIATFLLGLILSIFFTLSGQSPGFRAYEMELINIKTGKKPSFILAFWRYLCFLFSATTIAGIILCFFRKDGRNLHDLLSNTMCIKKEINV